MDWFTENGVLPYINAHDTYTIYGGSRMSQGTLQAMQQAAAHFVDFAQMQSALGERLAALTRNEAAYITNGASGGLLTAAAVCMAGDDPYLFARLPESVCPRSEIVVMRAQRNAYDNAISGAGASVVEVGDADETLDYMLEGAINEKTAAVFYFASTLYERGSMTLAQTIAIAHRRGVPVVVDAAAQLPPVENLWRFTQMGADMVLFSGGKTLCGPQDSGFIVGRKEWIARCLRFGAPAHGVCRSCKVSREAMAGLCHAVEEYVALDHAANGARLLACVESLAQAVQQIPGVRCEIVPFGPVGQTYPRLFLHLQQAGMAEKIAREMRARFIYIGLYKPQNAVSFSPLNLNDDETQAVRQALAQVLQACTKEEESGGAAQWIRQ